MSNDNLPESKNAAPSPVMLIILDGWGYREGGADNATAVANTPVFRKAWAESPRCFLQASEEYVGLPQGQMGNSEVGHMNIGGGRVVFQDLPLIDRTIARGEMADLPAMKDFIAKMKQSGGTAHLMGLASTGGVHSHQSHFVALAKILRDAGVPAVIHAFLDGRDTPPESAADFIEKLQKDIAPTKIVSAVGRYYAMDRDKRWDRVVQAYDLVTQGKGSATDNMVESICASYADKKTDEFVTPLALSGYDGMKDGDGVLFVNYRTDRAREILTALLDPSFDGFERKKQVRFAAALGMVRYADWLNPLMSALFPPKEIKNGLGEIVSKAGLKQLRIAETEKYAHVTFFFNGGREEPFEGEDRTLIPSPKVATYDLQPEMSAPEVTDKVVEAIKSKKYALIVLNYANPDMVGHTGILPAVVKALETVDAGLGQIFVALKETGGTAFVTADHGNCEIMVDPKTGGPHTAHTLDIVPAMLIGAPDYVKGLKDGKLADIAPTLLRFLGLPQPPDMDGESLIVG
jgi:2,3-bisphosphoglycerate-independent phosphoglycerate mutase